MSFKKAILALGLVSGLSSHAFAADVGPLLNAVDETAGAVEDLKGLINSGVVGTVSSETPAGPVFTPGAPSSDCSFCDEGTVEEGNPNLALNILAQAGGSLNDARPYLSDYAQGKGNLNFNFSFGCSFTGDASIDLASADLALGFPGNTNIQWRTKLDSSVNKMKTARTLAGCP